MDFQVFQSCHLVQLSIHRCKIIIILFYFQWIQARTTESSDDLPSTRTIFPTKITSPTTTTKTTTATPSGQKRTRNSTKLAEFQQKDFKPEIEVEPLSPSGQSETEKGETFRKASFFPDINKNNNAVTIKCSLHNNIVLLILMAIPVVEFQVWGYKIQYKFA